MARKFNDATVAFAMLAYPYVSNMMLADYIGCSVPWLEKLAHKHGIKKANLIFTLANGEFQDFDLTNKRYGSIEVINKTNQKDKNNVLWECKCDCGLVFKARSSLLRKGIITQCRQCRYGDRKNNLVAMENGEKWYMNKLKYEAFKRGIEYKTNTEECVGLYRRQNGKCALSGIDITLPYQIKKQKKGTGSIDRINSNGCYEINNIQWLHKDINLMKGSHSDQYFVELCCAVADHYRNSLINEQPTTS